MITQAFGNNVEPCPVSITIGKTHKQKKKKKQDAAHEPEYSHVEHFCETRYLNSLVIFSLLPYQCTVDCENAEVQSVECRVLSVECEV